MEERVDGSHCARQTSEGWKKSERDAASVKTQISLQPKDATLPSSSTALPHACAPPPEATEVASGSTETTAAPTEAAEVATAPTASTETKAAEAEEKVSPAILLVGKCKVRETGNATTLARLR